MGATDYDVALVKHNNGLIETRPDARRAVRREPGKATVVLIGGLQVPFVVKSS
jgi:hypothetical protein